MLLRGTKYKLELKSTITEIKNLLEIFNKRFKQVEKIHELEDQTMEHKEEK